MKTMTCKQLGGACDLEFKAESFEEIAEMSKNHGAEMMGKKDQPHLDAMNKMYSLMSDPDVMNKWFADRKSEFDAL